MSDKMNVNTAVEFGELKGQLQRIEDAIMTIKEKNEEMADDITKIKEAVYNPDEGLYARIKALEQWKESSQKITWIIMTTVVGLATTTIYKFIIG